MKLNAKQVAHCTGGSFLVEPIDARDLMSAITWDSREVTPGCLFVALPGERVDGHAFVGAALRAGAHAALVSQAPDDATMLLAREMGAAIIEVPNTQAAVVDLARMWRGQLKGLVIGLTGSSGKTTTKNLVRDVLASKLSVVATFANQNNELGVPRTLLNADADTQAVVVEMGMRGFGQIEALCDFVKPDWGLITNVGESHIELLGSREGIARAKSELIAALPQGTGKAFLNADDDYFSFVRDYAQVEQRHVAQVSYSIKGDPRVLDDGQAAVWASDVRLDDQGRPHFMLHAAPAKTAVNAETPDESVPCELQLRGMHNVSNACAAAAVGWACGIALADIAAALAGSLPESGRQELLRARGGFTVINDAYNANPESMKASLSVFCAMQAPGRRVAVLGDMGELGDYAQACHEGIGRLLAQLPLDRVVCVGELARFMYDAALAAGMPADKLCYASSVAEVLEDLEPLLDAGDSVLVKASHFMRLNRVVEGLMS